MKRNIRQCLIVAATALSFAACDVKDPIYNTPHPEQGAITLVTDWSGIGEGLTAPASYTVEAGDYSAILIAPRTCSNLFLNRAATICMSTTRRSTSP